MFQHLEQMFYMARFASFHNGTIAKGQKPNSWSRMIISFSNSIFSRDCGLERLSTHGGNLHFRTYLLFLSKTFAKRKSNLNAVLIFSIVAKIVDLSCFESSALPETMANTCARGPVKG